MKFETQLRVLQAFGRMSSDRRAIMPERLAQALNNEVSRHTAPLSHGFFVECGWLDRVGRGEYAASEVLLDYSRRVGAGLDTATAVLRSTATNGWFWRVMEPQLRNGAAPLPEVVVALMQEAEVGEPHQPQVRMLLEWMKYIGLIHLTEDKVTLAVDGPGGSGKASEQPVEEPTEDSGTPAPDPADQPRSDASLSGSTNQQPGRPGTILSFDFSCRITADDMAKLSAGQIKAMFEAVGTVMAVKNTL